MAVSRESAQEGKDNGTGRHEGRPSKESGGSGRNAITGGHQSPAVTDHDSIEPLPPPFKSMIMKSSTSSRVGFTSSPASQAEEDDDRPCSPTPSAGSPCHQDAQESPQADGVQPTSTASMSLADGQQHVHEDELSQQLRIPPCMNGEEQIALLTARLQPPVTKEGLSELELQWISTNVGLRIDINYDPNLEFTYGRGVVSELKKQESRKYWLSLEAELRIMYQHNLSLSCADCAGMRSSTPPRALCFKPRLPDMFLKLKELLTTLIPDREHDQIALYLDIPLLLQELSHGVLDIVRLAGWICQLLTSHCAPYRDRKAQDMADQIRDGIERGDIRALTGGVEKLFKLLEAMQLDVANYQIKNFRAAFIENTVDFQQNHFHNVIREGRLDVCDCRAWYNRAYEQHRHHKCKPPGQTSSNVEFVVFIHGLVATCCLQDEEIPETLEYDTSRLRTITAQIQDIIHTDLCLGVFNRLVRQLVGSARNPYPMHGTLRSKLVILTESDPALNLTVPEIWQQHHEAIALELTRCAFEFCQWDDVPPSAAVCQETATFLMWIFRMEGLTKSRARVFGRALEHGTLTYAQMYQRMSTREIAERQHVQSQRYWPQTPSLGSRILANMNVLAGRLAHIAVIHWRVWANLVYLAPSDEDDEAGWIEEEESGSRDYKQAPGDAAEESVQQEHAR